MAKRKRGRPSVAQTVYGDNAEVMEKIWAGGNHKTKRSTGDYIYSTVALRIIVEAASDIPYIETICRMEGNEPWFSRSILSQLGRMSVQDGYSNEEVIALAKIVANARHENCTVRQIELYIRNGRKTGEWG